MAAHNLSEAEMAYIEATIGIKADELQGSLREISTNAQIAFHLSHSSASSRPSSTTPRRMRPALTPRSLR